MINTTTPTDMLTAVAVFLLVVLGGIGILEPTAESVVTVAIAVTYVVMTERGEVVKVATVERALEAEIMAEKPENLINRTDAEDAEMMDAAEAKVVEVTVVEITVVETMRSGTINP